MERQMKIPELRFPEYLDSGDFQINELQNFLVRITYGFTNPMPEEDSGPYMITAKDILHGKIQYDTCRKTSQRSFDELLTDKSRPNIGDILLTKDGTLGRVAIVDNSNCCINQSVALLQINNDINSGFLFWLLSAPMYQNIMIKNAGGSTIKHIYITVVDKMKIAVPPLPEQQKIASFFTATDQKICQLKQKNTLLEHYKKGVMQKIFSQEIRFRDDNGKEFPKWEKKKLRELSIINPPTNKLPDDFIYIDLESVNNGELTKEVSIQRNDAPSRAQRVLEKGDILFQMVSGKNEQ